ncbi:hypothetical protein SDC9_207736 [bioreactor metagenome]|uniref:Uncharacterized protein n=1 Tax=bioreactor metagenome TaxID=1076179 RepID=A0A645JK54_9ZZZZ
MRTPTRDRDPLVFAVRRVERRHHSRFAALNHFEPQAIALVRLGGRLHDARAGIDPDDFAVKLVFLILQLCDGIDRDILGHHNADLRRPLIPNAIVLQAVLVLVPIGLMGYRQPGVHEHVDITFA